MEASVSSATLMKTVLTREASVSSSIPETRLVCRVYVSVILVFDLLLLYIYWIFSNAADARNNLHSILALGAIHDIVRFHVTR